MAKSEAWFQIFLTFLGGLNLHFLTWAKLRKHFSTFLVDHFCSVLEILRFCLMQYLFSYSFLAEKYYNITLQPCDNFSYKSKTIRESNCLEE